MVDTKKGFDVFSMQNEVTFSRTGKNVYVKGQDGTFQESDSVEANLLFEMLKEMRKKK